MRFTFHFHLKAINFASGENISHMGLCITAFRMETLQHIVEWSTVSKNGRGNVSLLSADLDPAVLCSNPHTKNQLDTFRCSAITSTLQKRRHTHITHTISQTIISVS